MCIMHARAHSLQCKNIHVYMFAYRTCYMMQHHHKDITHTSNSYCVAGVWQPRLILVFHQHKCWSSLRSTGFDHKRGKPSDRSWFRKPLHQNISIPTMMGENKQTKVLSTRMQYLIRWADVRCIILGTAVDITKPYMWNIGENVIVQLRFHVYIFLLR